MVAVVQRTHRQVAQCVVERPQQRGNIILRSICRFDGLQLVFKRRHDHGVELVQLRPRIGGGRANGLERFECFAANIGRGGGKFKFVAGVRCDHDRVSVIFAEQYADSDHIWPKFGERPLQIALRGVGSGLARGRLLVEFRNNRIVEAIADCRLRLLQVRGQRFQLLIVGGSARGCCLKLSGLEIPSFNVARLLFEIGQQGFNLLLGGRELERFDGARGPAADRGRGLLAPAP